MGIVVQKFGGSSVADVEKIRAVAGKVKARHAAGDAVVVVVSAMGDTTDDLLKLAQQVAPNPPRRELDMLLTCGERISMALLSMALHEQGVPAISFTGSQSGIITDDNTRRPGSWRCGRGASRTSSAAARWSSWPGTRGSPSSGR